MGKKLKNYNGEIEKEANGSKITKSRKSYNGFGGGK